ncbi:dynein axonemal heavy chain [Pseudoscourfieldia marina]
MDHGHRSVSLRLFATLPPPTVDADRTLLGVAQMQASVVKANAHLINTAADVRARFPRIGAWHTPDSQAKRQSAPFAPPPRFRSASAEPTRILDGDDDGDGTPTAWDARSATARLVDVSTLAAAYAMGQTTLYPSEGTTSLREVVKAHSRKRQQKVVDGAPPPTPAVAWWATPDRETHDIKSANNMSKQGKHHHHRPAFFFPLDHFDSLTDARDNDNNDNNNNIISSGGMVQHGDLGTSPWALSSGKKEWRPCTVVQTADEGTRLLIEWHEDGKQKWVGRLNFRPDDFLDNNQEERRRAAGQRCADEQTKLLRSLQLGRVALQASEAHVMLPLGSMLRLKLHMQEEYQRLHRRQRWTIGARNATIFRLLEEASEHYTTTVTTMAFDAACKTLVAGEGGSANLLAADAAWTANWKRKHLMRLPSVHGSEESTAVWQARNDLVRQSFFARHHLCSIILEAKQCLARIGCFRIFDDADDTREASGFADFFAELECRRAALLDTIQNEVVAQLDILIKDVRRIDGPEVACRMAKFFNAMLLRSIAEMLDESIEKAFANVRSATYAHTATFHVALEHNVKTGFVEYVPPLNDFAASIADKVRLVLDDLIHVRILKPSAFLQDDVTAESLAQHAEGAELALAAIPSQIGELKLFIEESVRSAGAEDTPASLKAHFHMHSGLLSGAGELYMQQIRERAAGRSDEALVEEWEEAVAQLKREENEVIQSLPGHSRMGMFVVSADELRSSIIHGARRLAGSICKEISREVDTICAGTLDTLNKILASTTKDVTNLEEMQKMKLYVEEATKVLDSSVQEELENARCRCELLDKCDYLQSDAIVDTVLRTRGQLQADVRESLALVKRKLPKLRDEFAEQLEVKIDKFSTKIQRLSEEVKKWQDVSGFDDAERHAKKILNLTNRLEDAAKEANLIQTRQELLYAPRYQYTELLAMRTELTPYVQLWTSCDAWQENHARWFYGPVFAVDMEAVESMLPKWLSNATKLQDVLGGAPFRVAKTFRGQLEEFRRQLPVLRSIRTTGMRERHWSLISLKTGMDRSTFSPEIRDQELSLETLIRLGAMNHIKVLQEVAELASRENTVEKAIEALAVEWNSMEIILQTHSQSNSYVLRNADSVMDALDEAMLKIQALSLSSNVGPHLDRISYWDSMLQNIHESLVLWLDVQRKYVHLTPLFRSTHDAGPAMIADMPLESARFGQADEEWKHTITEILTLRKDSFTPAHQPDTSLSIRLVDAVNRTETMKKFVKIGSMLDSIMKSVRTFLGRKRVAYPRLGLISDEELLDALKLAGQPLCAQKYVPRLFSGCAAVNITQRAIDAERNGSRMEQYELYTIVEMHDSLGEVLELRPPCATFEMNEVKKTLRRRSSIVAREPSTNQSGKDDANVTLVNQLPIEEWLRRLELRMALSVQRGINEAFEAYPEDAPQGTFAETVEAGVAHREDDAHPSEAQDDHGDRASGNESQLSQNAVDDDLEPATIDEWVISHPNQCVLIANAVRWTGEVERALDAFAWEHDGGKALRDAHENTNLQLDACVQRMRHELVSSHDRASLSAFLVRSVYHRDVAARLGELAPQRGSEDFEWIRCVRFYRNHDASTITLASGAPREDTKQSFSASFGADAGARAEDHLQSAGFGVVIRCASADLVYGNEFIGCAGHLVVTPITERAYVSLATALMLSYAPAPQGPAGTGKTETIKDLSRLCGRHVVTMNCSEGVDVTAMTRIIEGVASSGSWACFDELNRLSPDLLSFVSSMLLRLQTALRANESTCEFDGVGDKPKISISSRCACFVTLNPAYMSRNPLPESLSALLRPIAIMVADLRYIAEVQLFCIGFSHAPMISAKLACFLRTVKTQVEQQIYHDTGMRALRGVLDAMQMLRIASELGAGARRTRRDEGSSPQLEETMCRQALLQTVLPRLGADEGRTVSAMIDELFPHSDVRSNSKSSYDVLTKALKSVAFEWHSGKANEEVAATLEGAHTSIPKLDRLARGAAGRDPVLVRCASRLSDTLAVRTGAIVLGSPGSGKSACIRLLADTVNYLMASDSSMVDLRYVNPCAIPPECVYGVQDQAAGEWSDGVVTMHLRKFASHKSHDFPSDSDSLHSDASDGERDNEPPKMHVLGPLWGEANSRTHRWLVMDGPLLSMHAESLNSVLDDTRELFLSTGEVIPLLSNARILFECDQLVHASPATVSRCGVIHIEPTLLDATESKLASCERFMLAWVHSLPRVFAHYKPKLEMMTQHFLWPIISNTDPKRVHTNSLSIVANFARLYAIYLDLLGKGENIFAVSQGTMQLLKGVDGVLKLGLDSTDVNGILASSGSGWHSQISSQGMHMRLECLFVHTIVLTVGAVIQLHDREKFSNELRRLCAMRDARTKRVSSGTRSENALSLSYPDDGTVYDYCFDLAACEWRRWDEIAKISLYDRFIQPQFDLVNPSGPVSTTLAEGLCIPTSHNAPAIHVFDLFAERAYNVAICGPCGSGKTTIIRNCVERDVPMRIVNPRESAGDDALELSLDVCDHAITRSTRVDNGITLLGQHLNRRHGYTYGPRVGKRGMALVLDDIHLAADGYTDTSSPSGDSMLELVRQLLDTRGYYYPKTRADRSSSSSSPSSLNSVSMAPMNFGLVNDVQVLATFQSTGQTGVSHRLLRHMATVFVPEMSKSSASAIFSAYVDICFDGTDTVALEALRNCALASGEIMSSCTAHAPWHHSRAHSSVHSASRIMDCIAKHGYALLEPLRLALMWSHEARREYVDCLDQAETEILVHVNESLREIVKKCFPREVDRSIELLNMHLDSAPTPISFTYLPANTTTSANDAATLTDFSNDSPSSYSLQLIDVIATKIRDQLIDYDEISGDSQRHVEHAVAKTPVAGVSSFPSFTSNVNNLIRILRRPFGHALLVGQNGRGKRTIARAAAHMCGLETFELRCAESLTEHDITMVIRDSLHSAGVHGHKTLLLVHDDAAMPPQVASMVDYLLRTRCLSPPGLWGVNDEELVPALETILRQSTPKNTLAGEMDDMREKNRSGDRKGAARRIFVERCQQNIRICWCTNAYAGSNRENLFAHPSLITCTTSLAIAAWASADRREVAELALTPLWKLAKHGKGSPRLADALSVIRIDDAASACASVQEAIDQQNAGMSHTTSEAHYTEFVKLVPQLLYRRLNTLHSDFARYSDGVNQMDMIESRVNAMKDSLTSLEAQIKSSTIAIEELMRSVELKQAEASIESEKMSSEEKIMSQAVAELTELREKCSAELDLVMPPLTAAIKDLEGIKKGDISELKSMNDPPRTLKLVMKAVCVLLGRHPPGLDVRAEAKMEPDLLDKLYWREAQKFLGEQTCLSQLIHFDRDNVDESLIEAIDKYTALPFFNAEKVRKVSKAGMCMCKWVLAMDKYYDVQKIMLPKKLALENAERELDEKQAKLDATKMTIAKLEQSIRALKEEMDGAIGRREKMYRDSATAADKIQRAAEIMTGFKTERNRWTASVRALERERGMALGDSLLAAAHIVYLGAYPSVQRDAMMRRVVDKVQTTAIPTSENFDLAKALCVPSIEVSRWEAAGLPTTSGCIASAHVAFSSRKYTFIIDPELRATRWLRSLYTDTTGHAFVSASELLVSTVQDGSHTAAHLATMHRAHAPIYSALIHGSTCVLERVGERLGNVLEELLQFRLTRCGPATSFTRNLNAYGVDVSATPSAEGYEYGISLGGVLIPYDPRAKITFVTSRSAVTLPLDLQRSVTLVDFSINRDELEAELMHHLAKSECAHLLDELSSLRISHIKSREELEVSENELLRVISQLDVRHILETDETLKLVTTTNLASQREASRGMQMSATRRKVDDFCQAYALPTARRAAISFIAIRQIAQSCPAYEFGLDWFLSCIFDSILERSRNERSRSGFGANSGGGSHFSRSASVIADRAEELCARFSRVFWHTMSQALFDKHQLPLAFLLSIQLLETSSPTVQSDASLFLSCVEEIEGIRRQRSDEGYGSDDDTDVEDDEEGRVRLERPSWIDAASWHFVRRMCIENSRFTGLDKAMCGELPGHNALDWEHYATTRRTDRAALTQGHSILTLPDSWNSLATILKLVVLRIIAPARTNEALIEFVQETLGHGLEADPHQQESALKRVTTVDAKLEHAYERSSSSRPILLVVSPGNDPTARIAAFAQHKRRRLLHVSMSAGNEQDCVDKILQTRGRSRWVLINNVHLSSNRFREKVLPHIIDNLIADASTDFEFRLFLITAPTDAVPASVYASSHKLVAEASYGSLQKHMNDAWTVLGADGSIQFEEDGERHPRLWRRMLSAISLFHALLLERKRFGVYGWCAPNTHLGAIAGDYRGPAVSVSDVEVCKAELRRLLRSSHHPDTDLNLKLFFRSIISSVYEAKSTDPFDMRVLRAVAQPFENFDQYRGSDTERHLFAVTQLLLPHGEQWTKKVAFLPDDASLADVKAHASQPSIDVAYESFHVHRELRRARLDTRIGMTMQGIRDLIKVRESELNSAGGDGEHDGDEGIAERLDNSLHRMRELEIGQIRASPVGNHMADEISRMLSFLESDTARKLHMNKYVPQDALSKLWPTLYGSVESKKACSIAKFMSRLEAQCDYLHGWHMFGAMSPPDLGVPLPPMVNASMHSQPRAIFDAALRNHARMTHTSLDELTFKARFKMSAGSIGSPVPQSPMMSRRRSSISGRRAIAASDSNTISLTGMRLCGAMWDSSAECLVDTLPDGDDAHDMYGTPFPLIWLAPSKRTGAGDECFVGMTNVLIKIDASLAVDTFGPVEAEIASFTSEQMPTPVANRRHRGTLVPKGSLHVVPPTTPTASSQIGMTSTSPFYLCPVYTSMDRVGQNHRDEGNVVMAIPLPCGAHSAAHWVRRGVFLVLDHE